MAGDQILVARMADADAHPPEVGRADLGGDRAQAVVPRHPAAGLDAELAGGEVELVVADHDLRERQLEEADRLGDRVAGVVHEGLRLEQQHPLVTEMALAEQAGERCARARNMSARDRVGRHETEVVPVPGVAGAWIAEPDEQQHPRSLVLARLFLGVLGLAGLRFLAGRRFGFFGLARFFGLGHQGGRGDGRDREVAIRDRGRRLRAADRADMQAVAMSAPSNRGRSHRDRSTGQATRSRAGRC